MLAAKISFGNKELDPQEWRYFLAGPSGDFKVKMNPTSWISESSWPDIFRQFYGMQELKKLEGIY
jgi:dynein heavy chain